VILGGIDVALILTSDHIDVRGAWAAVALVIGWGFIGAGLFAWDRRPNNSVGSLMVATGFAWLLSLLSASNLDVLFTFGVYVSSIYFVTAIHMLLAAPYGRGLSRGDRRIVTVGYLLVTVGVLPLYLFLDPAKDGCDGCPGNAILIEHNQTIVDVASALVNLVGIGVLAAVMVSLIRRWRRATRPERRLYAPVYASGVALMIAVIGQLALQTAGGEGSALDIVFIVSMIPLALVPYLFLASFVRARMLQGGAVGELMSRLSAAPRSGQVRDALADALEDPSLELVYWLPEQRRYVDGNGREYDLPEDDPSRAVTKVEREGECVAAIVHDPTLPQMRGHVEAVGAAAALALDNERLDAELRAKIDELRASRERMLRIGLEERRRLERDLHDGAQQRLVSMALNIRLARSKLNEDPLAADQLLDSAGRELDSALAELRELARGIHPAVLTDRGLGTALETLAHRAPVPVELAELPQERLPEAVELAAYFVVAEALTNVAKYANASHAKVEVARENGRVLVEVEDDGVGGANPEKGTGLRGLADRIAVLEGRLEIDSERGRGTTVRARIPCA
jgi:signal transduction histidine kinase